MNILPRDMPILIWSYSAHLVFAGVKIFPLPCIEYPWYGWLLLLLLLLLLLCC